MAFGQDIREIAGALKPGIGPYIEGERCRFLMRRRDFAQCGKITTRGHYCAEHATRMYAGVPVRKKAEG